MKNLKTMLSSQSNEWETPQYLFDELNKEFNFNFDPCATKENAKCKYYCTKEENGLDRDWDGYRIFCNPPYGTDTPKWVKKASEAKDGTVVLLIPARTDTKYFHQYIYHKAEIRFIRGRIKFVGNQKGSGSAPFPSMIVIFRRKEQQEHLKLLKLMK